MIAKLSAAMAAIKETAGLAKVINNTKTDVKVKVATIELQSKLIILQAEYFSLGDAIRAKEGEAAILCSKLAVLEDFKKATQEYSILKTPGGTLVYSALIDGSNDQFAINACPRCFQQSRLSILQPSPTTHSIGGYFIHYCPLCKSEFKTDKVSPMPPVQVLRRFRRPFQKCVGNIQITRGRSAHEGAFLLPANHSVIHMPPAAIPWASRLLVADEMNST